MQTSYADFSRMLGRKVYERYLNNWKIRSPRLDLPGPQRGGRVLLFLWCVGVCGESYRQ